MTDIILEGPDGAGKSTLAAQIARALNMPYIHSGGPAKNSEEINKRAMRFIDDPIPRVYDRHPCISQMNYQMALKEPNDRILVAPEVITKFYNTNPMIIYCQSAGYVSTQPVGVGSNSEFEQEIAENHYRIMESYDDWGKLHATILYRIGDPISRIIEMVKGTLYQTEFNPVRDIEEFHSKFDLIYDGTPRTLPKKLFKFRHGFALEEITEYGDAAELARKARKKGNKEEYAQQLEDQLDALIDAVYVILGTSYLQGFDFIEGWRRVHEANMKKIRTSNPDDSTRSSSFDVVKPEGWVPPTHKDLVSVNDVTGGLIGVNTE